MSEPSTPSPIEAPPPAYEVAQLDFDQKLVIAAERSLDISEQRRQRRQEDAVVEREEDEEALGRPRESHASRNSDSRSIPAVRPLAFKKKSRKKEESNELDKRKERPSWFAEARLSTSTSVPGVSRRPLPEPGQTHESNTRSQQHILPEDPDEDRSYPPPPFALVDNSLDGPPYEAYAANNGRPRRTGNTVVLRYTGEDLAASPPPSPPHSPIARYSSQNSLARQRAGSPHNNPLNNAYPHVSQQSHLQVQIPLVRPRSAESQRYVPPPRLNFNHSVAYEGSKLSFYGRLPADAEETTHDATALYSSSVAPHLTPHLTSRKTNLAPPPVKRRYTPSVASLPEYDQSQQHTTHIATGKSPYAVQDYAASRTSVYSQSSVSSVQQYPHIAQYPQMAQYPTQQNYARPISIARQGDAQRWSTINQPHESQYYPR